MGSEVSDLQQGCLWQNDHLLSVSLSGYINYLDKNNPNRPLRVIKVSVSSTEGTIPEILARISCDVQWWKHCSWGEIPPKKGCFQNYEVLKESHY